jgi:membrane fusion protein (multidrug efflux system)
MKSRITLLFLTFLIVFSCKKEEKAKSLPPQDIKVYKIEPRSVPIYQEFVGQVYGAKDIPIRARVEGFLENVHFVEGSRVKKGQLLYTIDPKPFLETVAAQKSMVAQAETMLIQNESDLKRVIPLAELDAVSKRELDMAKAKRDASISSLEAAKANLNIADINLGYAKIYAPINGIIGKTLAQEGEFVGKSPNPVILNTISQINSIRVQFFLSENEYLIAARSFLENKKVKTIGEQREDRDIELLLSDGSVYKFKGKIDFIDRNIDPSTGSILLQASFPNPEGLLRPGQFARLKIKIYDDKDALLVPQKAISELQGQYSVFVVGDDNKVVAKQVTAGEKVGEFWIIEEGVKSGDRVVLEGLQKIRSGMEIVPVDTAYESVINDKK